MIAALCVECSSHLVSGRETVAGAYSRGLWRKRRALLDPAVLRGLCVEESSLLVSRRAKPWQGTPEGGLLDPVILWQGARGDPPGSALALCGRVITFGLEAAKPWRELGSAWKGRHFWSPGARNRGKGVL